MPETPESDAEVTMSRVQHKQETPGHTGRRHRKQSKVKKVGKVITTCFLIAFIAVAALTVKRVVIPVIGMYKEAIKMVEESTEDTFKAEQTSIVYDVNEK